MPPRAKSICARPGCRNLVDAGIGRCPKCQARKDEEQRARERARPSATSRGYDSAWRAVSRRFLEANPICIDCGAPAKHADHVIPIEERPDLRLHFSNLAARCVRCHSRKTCLYDGGFGLPRRPLPTE